MNEKGEGEHIFGSWKKRPPAKKSKLKKEQYTLIHTCDSGKLLTRHHHIFRKTDSACTQNKMGMVKYLGGVLSVILVEFDYVLV